MPTRGLVPALLLALAGCSGSDASNQCEGLNAAACARPDGGASSLGALVVDVPWLEEHLGDSDVQLIDTRASGYDQARIPGAIHLRPEDLATSVDGIPSQIRPSMEAQQVLREAGLRNEATAVVYGTAPEYDPSRVVWSLRYFRHADVRYLDGGYTAWIDAGGDLDTAPPDISPSAYTIVGVDETLHATGDWVLEQLDGPPYDMPAIQLVDARSESEYGAGRIPSARNANWTTNLNGGFLRPVSELGAVYQGFDSAKTTVTYCVSGWRGSFAWLTLTALGYEDVRLYDASWNEWGSGNFPVERQVER
jgi:thiosulfate/3-mercaptopyruvate sulfurtransferase